MFFRNVDYRMVDYRRLRAWAERGIIHIEHKDTGAYDAISVRDWLARLRATQEMLQEARKDPSNQTYRAAIAMQDLLRAIEDGIEIARKAKEQGMPSDPSARRDLARRQRLVVSVPGSNSSF